MFDIQEPLILLYNEVEELEQLATAAQHPCTNRQIVDLGVHLLKNATDFEKGSIDWFALPISNQTWSQVKIHFDNACATLKNACGPTMQNTTFQQHANTVTRNALSEINTLRIGMQVRR